jgi:hypothetical protein
MTQSFKTKLYIPIAPSFPFAENQQNELKKQPLHLTLDCCNILFVHVGAAASWKQPGQWKKKAHNSNKLTLFTHF